MDCGERPSCCRAAAGVRSLDHPACDQGLDQSMSVDHPMIAIVIPVHNGAKFLAGTIDSAFSQSYRPIQVIVVDDGSTDVSFEIASSYGDVIVHHQFCTSFVIDNVFKFPVVYFQ